MKHTSIPFSLPAAAGNEMTYIKEAIDDHRLSGDRKFSSLCSHLLSSITGAIDAFMTPSCTHALEMAALLTGIKPGDEVIMPSFTFTSTANAFVLRGARIVFVDIRADTMNIDEEKVEDAISKKTRAIVPVHYAGVGCEMNRLLEIADNYRLFLLEDAAQCLGSYYEDRHLGTFGQFGAISFHETKNIQCGEGGVLLVNDSSFSLRAEIVREKGTNRAQFFRGETDRYTWLDVGSSQLLGELSAAYLYAQLEKQESINAGRLETWQRYMDNLSELSDTGTIDLPTIPEKCTHNGHIFYIKVRDAVQRAALIRTLHDNNIHATFHYVPLHTTSAGKKYSVFHGEDRYTTIESSRLLRLPVYSNMSTADIDKVCDVIINYLAD